MIHNNFLEIRALEKLCDTLLPKLMSGEVRVSFSGSLSVASTGSATGLQTDISANWLKSDISATSLNQVTTRNFSLIIILVTEPVRVSFSGSLSVASTGSATGLQTDISVTGLKSDISANWLKSDISATSLNQVTTRNFSLIIIPVTEPVEVTIPRSRK